MTHDSRLPKQLLKIGMRLASGELAWDLKGVRRAIHLLKERQAAVTAGSAWQKASDGSFSKKAPAFSWHFPDKFRAGDESWIAYCSRCRVYSFYHIVAVEEKLPASVRDSFRFQLEIRYEP